MSRVTNSNLAKSHRAFARVLSFLLLGFIVYTTTVEAAHTHGRLAVSNTVVGARAFSDPATNTKANKTLLGCGDCLICQLHQGFSATLISGPPSLNSSSLTSRVSNASTVLVRSATIVRRSGRAPPPVSF